MTIADILGCGRAANVRPKDDFFQTPLECTASIVAAEANFLPKTIWEPCAGNDAIAGFLEAMGYRVIKTDLNRKTDGIDKIDFLLERKPQALAVVTNPPFTLAREIIVHAKGLGVTYMALLLKSDFFNCGESADVWDIWPPARIHALTWRPDFRRQGRPTMTCSWYVWDSKSPTCSGFTPMRRLKA